MIQRVLTGFAAGVMVAASVWSLRISAMEQSELMGKLPFHDGSFPTSPIPNALHNGILPSTDRDPRTVCTDLLPRY